MTATLEQAAALLDWYRAMGVDEAIAGEPSPWFGAEEVTVLPRIAPQPRPQAAAPTLPRIAPRSASAAPQAVPIEAGAEAMEARELARSARSLEELRALLEGFEGCGLKKTAKRLCLSRGSAKAELMLIGEAPGKDEDEAGAPFVGRAGKLLDRMLAAIGLGEEHVYITNIVFWRPPGNRTPSPQEVQICQPFVERQIELLGPKIIVLLGNAAAQQLTGSSAGITKLRGKWHGYALPGQAEARRIPLMPTLHPAFLLRTPIAKRLAWRDLLLIREALDGKPIAF